MFQPAPLRRYGFRWIIIMAALTFLRPSAFSSDTDRRIDQLYHTSWNAKDGAPTQITGIARTNDGYLWLASHLGLFRFNGLSFEPYIPPPGGAFPSYNILNVLGTRDGGLWVSFEPSGAAFIKDNHVQVFDLAGLALHSFVEDLDGRVWATTLTSLRYFDGATWKEVRDPNLAGKRIWTLFCDRSGGLWVATDMGVNFLPRRGKSFQQMNRYPNVRQLDQSKKGEIWMSDWSGLIRPVFVDPRRGHPRSHELRTNSAAFFFDRDGSLWIKESGVGRLRDPFDSAQLRRASNDRVEWFTSQDGLTDDSAGASMEDEEGDIWIATSRGLDRFRHSAFAPIRAKDPTTKLTLQIANGGGVWMGSATPFPISLVRGDEIYFRGPRTQVASVCLDSHGTIWWGGHGGIWRQDGKHFSFFPQPKSLQFDWIWEVVPDNQRGGLWVGIGDSGLRHFKDGIWSDAHLPHGLPNITPSATFYENGRGTWFGYDDDQVAELSNGGNVKLYTAADGLDIGRIRVIRGSKDLIWFGGETGLEVLRNGHFKNVLATGAVPIGTVSGIAEASDGSLWLNELHGVLRISPADIERISKDSSQAVSPRRFDSLDGLPGSAQVDFRSSTILESSDRRIWVATDGGAAWTDPSKEHANAVAPPVLITGVRTNTRNYGQVADAELPPGTTTVQFTYQALNLSIPERVRYRYILKTVDDSWHYVDKLRDATYQNLSPGHYQFTVAASDGDGNWNPIEASVQVSILPLFYQTLWFRTLAALALAMLIWMIFLVRLRQSNERIEARLGERLMERDRIARELHDTLLQGFQMLVLRFQVITDTISTENPVRRMLEDGLTRAERTLQEGRDKVAALRSETEAGNDMAAELAQIGRDLSTDGRAAFRLTVEGNPKEIHRVVYEEILMIAREAITNSFRHAHADMIECVIQFAPRHFSFACRDDGGGIPESMLDAGANEGHWGLLGMKERAAKIGADLRIIRSEAGGTEVELRLTARIAYGATSQSRLLRMLRHGR